MWLQYYDRQMMAVLMRGLEAAFRYFGGVPSELLFDQMKAVIVDDHWDVGGRLVENPEFVRFSVHWGFRIRACRPYRTQTKGKVERPVSYIQRNFFYGRTFASDDDLNAQARRWLDTALPPGGAPAYGAVGTAGRGGGVFSARRGRAPPAVRVRPDRRTP